MPSVADYFVLRDGPITVETGESFETDPFFKPDGFVEGTHRAKAILAFNINPLPDPPFSASVDFTINQIAAPLREIVHYNGYTAAGPVVLWETFPATGFGTNVGTQFLFAIQRGRVTFSDIVLWYQLRI